MDASVMIEQVRTREDFVCFIHKLKEDTYINTDEWENKDILSYLESINGGDEPVIGKSALCLQKGSRAIARVDKVETGGVAGGEKESRWAGNHRRNPYLRP